MANSESSENKSAEAGLFHSHDMQIGGDPVHHTVYSDLYSVPEGTSADRISDVIDPICRTCTAIHDLVNVTRSMRIQEGKVDAWCSIYDSSVTMGSKNPGYSSQNVRCPLLERKILQKRLKD